jgi:1,2-diacylglycerol 3-alpha-glucosyltransferase
MSAPPLLCWVLVNSVPYHEARFRAAAENVRLRLRMVQLTEVDAFRILQQGQVKQPFRRYTLFPDTPWDRIDGRVMALRLRACLSEIKPSVICINGWSFGGGIAALSWCLSNKVPAIVISESTAFDEPRRWWKEAIKQRIVGLCSAALVGGSDHGDYMKVLGVPSDRIFTGYDAVDNEHFRAGAEAARRSAGELRARLGLPARYIMACSRFTPKKNLPRLLQAYALYRRAAGPAAWSLVIVGEGDLGDELIALRDRLRLGTHVQFPGAKPYHELPTYYGLAGAFVHASTTEQWGLVINEAMASGLPVLVSNRCGCARDLVAPGINGLLFDPYDIHALAGAMRDITADGCDRQEMGRAGQEIVSRWSPAQFSESLMRAAETALGAAQPTPTIADRFLLWMLRPR